MSEYFYLKDKKLVVADDMVCYDVPPEGVVQLINDLISSTTPDNNKYLLLDSFDRFDQFKGQTNLFMDVAGDYSAVKSVLEKVEGLIRARLQFLAHNRMRSIEEYNQTAERKWPNVLVIFYEISDYTISRLPVLQKVLLNDDNAGFHVLAFSRFSQKVVNLGKYANMFRKMEFSELKAVFDEA